MITKALEKSDPELADCLQREADRLLALVERRKAVACRNRTAALLTIADAVISRYQRAKQQRGLLDYDDLIDKARTLLGEDRAAWVHYKLDQGIDHVLIDEAQDTSPKQWEIIRLLTEEFFAGAGARAINRTIFAVGDEKQSIFSFQGAAPREFDAMRHTFTTLCAAIGRNLQYVPFRHSFRSGPNLLGAVDKVFERPEAHRGLSADNVRPVHEWLPEARPGLVEIWDTLKPNNKREMEDWDAPFNELTEKRPQVRLTAKLAATSSAGQKQGTRGERVDPGAPARSPIRGDHPLLKDAHVPVAG